MEQEDLDRLLDPKPLPLETGYRRLANGVLHVAVRTFMPSCTGEMFEWWFRFRPDTQAYAWWHPVDHVSSTWVVPEDGGVIGSKHLVEERLTDLPTQALTIQFRDPEEFFTPELYRKARDSGDVSAAIMARSGMGHEAPTTPAGAVIGNRLFHVGRDRPDGLVLRSHLFLGYDLTATGTSAETVAAHTPDFIASNFIQHGFNEMTFLARLLPSIFIGENRHKLSIDLPW